VRSEQKARSPEPRALSLSRELSPSPLPESDGPVNLLHMELLHHFEQLTIPSLAFNGIWPSMIQLAFHVCLFSIHLLHLLHLHILFFFFFFRNWGDMCCSLQSRARCFLTCLIF
jgi:hypothetical protein